MELPAPSLDTADAVDVPQSEWKPVSHEETQADSALGQDGVDSEAQRGSKRKESMDPEVGIKKVRRTIGWYNHKGGLHSPISYRDVASSIEAIDPRQALRILKGLEDKKDEIRNPTAWVRSAAEHMAAQLDQKVRKTIAWYNRQGKLVEPISFDEVRSCLSRLQPEDALYVLKGLDGKEDTILKPTAWICKAAQKLAANKAMTEYASWGNSSSWKEEDWSEASGDACGRPQGRWVPHQAPEGPKDDVKGEVSQKVKATIRWYNRHGGLQQEIRFDEVSPSLAQIGSEEALHILKGLDGKGPEIRNPTSWINSAAWNFLAQT